MANYGPSNTFVAGRFNVWIPNRTQGAFVSFDTASEAQNDVRGHQIGVVLNPAGQLDPSLQVWSQWSQYQSSFSAPVVLNPSPGSPVASPGATAGINTVPSPAASWLPAFPAGAQSPIVNSQADILGVYARAIPGGAELVVRTHNQKLNETLTYELYVPVPGSEVKVKNLGTQAMPAGSYVCDAFFTLDYAELSKGLAAIGAQVGPGTKLAVRVMWPGGHDQGALGAGGRGAHTVSAP